MSPSSLTDPAIPERLPIRAYFILNAAFWLICLIFFTAARYFMKPIEGITIFFFALAIGFTLVSIFDYLCTVLTPTPADNTEDIR